MKNQDGLGLADEEGQPITTGAKVYIETYYKTYLQSFADIDDETTNMFTYTDSCHHEYYTNSASTSNVAVVAGQKQLSCEDGEPKMVF